MTAADTANAPMTVVVSEMTYTVSSGTLNSSIPYRWLFLFAVPTVSWCPLSTDDFDWLSSRCQLYGDELSAIMTSVIVQWAVILCVWREQVVLSEVESVKCVSCGKSDVNKLGDVEEMIRCATCSRSGPPFSSHHPLLPTDVDYVFIFIFFCNFWHMYLVE